MPYRIQDIEKDQFYHIYNRGNNKDKIFFEKENYRFFLQKFVQYLPPDNVEIHAFCLMPNHYHLLVRLASEFDYSTGMKYFGIAYVKSINSWYGRVGHLFQGRFRAKHVVDSDYLLNVTRYIHLNPVRAKLVRSAEDWKYSSYRAYLHCENTGHNSVNPGEISELPARIYAGAILSNFDRDSTYKRFVESALDSEVQSLEEHLWL